MGRQRLPRETVEFGDFQTPELLAVEVCRLLHARGIAPRSIVEPTCGVGNLLFAALDTFPGARQAHALDVNDTYVEHALRRKRTRNDAATATITRANFFNHDWPTLLERLEEPILVIGNPPWVTSADLGSLRSENLPEKRTSGQLQGLAAMTGKSNFDISEWMLTRLIAWLDGKRATVAVLCKTAVARKVLSVGWTEHRRITNSAMYRIDSAQHFGAAVDACLLIVELSAITGEPSCPVHRDISDLTPETRFGHRHGVLVADATLYDRWLHLAGQSPYIWRSGVKHDCAAVMELIPVGDTFENGDGERIRLEERYLFPMLKSSDLARIGEPVPRRWMLVPQSFVGEDTSKIEAAANETWRYLNRHKDRIQLRASSIYRGKPPFSIFGVGDYTFSPWKVAISGLYKRLTFKAIGPYAGKPVVLDDTCYSLACSSEAEARFLVGLLASPPAQEFYSAFIFWDAKRPITTDILRRLDLRRLAHVLGLERDFARLCHPDPTTPASTDERPQLQLALDDVPVIARRRRTASAAKRVLAR
jgi:hypothetical protein